MGIRTKNLYVGRLKPLAILTTVLLYSFVAHAYTITGRILDANDSKPLRKAEIIVRNDSLKIVAGVNSDQNGNFSTSDIKEKRVTVEVAINEYAPIFLKVVGDDTDNLDLGNIELKRATVELDEVEVTAQSVIQKPDRYIVIPSKSEIERSAGSLALLNELQMKMPGLRVIETLQSVTIDNRAPIFKINGKPVDMNRFLSINNDNILRIEYFDTPDIRYNNRSVINIILKPRHDGGSLVTSLLGAVNFAGFVNGNFGATYYNKKSEWNVNYNLSWRDYDKREVSSSEQFIGRENPIIRETVGIPSPFGYTTNSFSLGYTYMHNANTMFAVTVGVSLLRSHLNDRSNKTEIIGAETTKYETDIKRTTKFSSPDINLFFRKQIRKDQLIEVNATSSYNKGDYTRNYTDIYTEGADKYINTLNNNKSLSVGAELLYSKQFKLLTTNFAIKDSYNFADNSVTENSVLTFEKFRSNQLSAYAQAVGRIKKLGYSASLGLVYLHSLSGDNKLDAVRMKTNVTLNYQFSKKWSLNYLFMYDPSMPSFNQQSDVVNKVDEILIRKGNKDLKPSVWFRNRVYARYTEGKFTGSFWVSHSRTVSPIYSAYSYISDPKDPYYNSFMVQPTNGKYIDRFNFELNLGVQNLFNHLSLFGVIGWNDYILDLKDEHYTDKRFYISLQGSLYFGQWTFSANYDILPQYSMPGNVLSRSERWNTVGIQYRLNNWRFSLTGINLFTKRGALYEDTTLSTVHPEESEVSIKDNANMVMLGINYRVNFGKSFNKARRSLQNRGGIDTGVNINY
ncbi:MAG: carboxypeptidase regulatory-like domain-containing protein [Muribaculaceae bacterium]|nr:carboxypeptidase regulatory-like domain-containing protein [Muribaculaceae bacterium]